MQQPIRNVLAATDFSAGAQAAVRRAAVQAGELKADLTLMHVVERDVLVGLRELFAQRDLWPAMVEQGRIQLEASAGAVASAYQLKPGTLLREGAAVQELRAAGANADLLVIGARDDQPLRDLSLGKTADRLARLAARPLLVVRQEPEHGYRRVLVPVDFSDNSHQAVLAARALAPGASLHLLHCFDLPYEGRMRMAGATNEDLARYRSQMRLDAEDKMRLLADGLGGDPGRIATSIVPGDVRFELSRLVQQERADLVAVGKQGSSLMGDTFLGSVTSWALSHVACDVLVVPAAAVPTRP